MRIHIIAVGGRIMHTIALVLKEEGHIVTGSDDEIYEPSKSKLENAGLLPDKVGWDKERISSDIDFIILGMHARSDNPELLLAREMGIEVLSYPEFIYRKSKLKKRVVIAGSHGKTTTTSMIMHVLKYRDIEFDYLVGAELDGFSSMIKLSDAPLIIIEGDEYLSSCEDRRPKMQHYRPDIAVVTGIEWDHVNVFKTEEDYNGLFETFIDTQNKETIVYAYEDGGNLDKLIERTSGSATIKRYAALTKLENDNVVYENKQYRINVFGKHNRANMMAALQVCMELGITPPDFFAGISTFKGASRRMEMLLKKDDFVAYRDFAHAPSKVRATVEALREHFPQRKIITFLELHTFSSLNASFLPKYGGSMSMADLGFVYYSEHTLTIKKLPMLHKKEVKTAFGGDNIQVLNRREELESAIEQIDTENCVIVMMSSGNFDKIDVKGILIKKL